MWIKVLLSCFKVLLLSRLDAFNNFRCDASQFSEQKQPGLSGTVMLDVIGPIAYCVFQRQFVMNWEQHIMISMILLLNM